MKKKKKKKAENPSQKYKQWAQEKCVQNKSRRTDLQNMKLEKAKQQQKQRTIHQQKKLPNGNEKKMEKMEKNTHRVRKMRQTEAKKDFLLANCSKRRKFTFEFVFFSAFVRHRAQNTMHLSDRPENHSGMVWCGCACAKSDSGKDRE